MLLNYGGTSLLEKLVKLEPTNGNGYWQLGWEFSKKGVSEKSIENYNKCIQLDPNSASAHNNAGVEYERLERFNESLKAYEMALSVQSGKALYHVNKARILLKLGRADESIAIYKNAINLFPDEERVYVGLLNTLNELKRYDDMLEYYDLAIKNFKEKSQAYNYDKAFLLAQLDKADEAVQILTNLAAQNYQTNNCYLKIADIRLKQGNQKEGISVLDMAISMDPKNGDFYLKKAELLSKDQIARAYETIIDGFHHVKKENYLQKGARIIADAGEIVRAQELYKMAGDICKAKLLEKENESDLMNYYESLLINKEYDEAEKVLNKHKGIITSDKYRFVLRALKLFANIMQKAPIKLEEEINYFETATIPAKSGWNFDDILNYLQTGSDDKNHKFISAVIQLLRNEIDKDEFKKIVR